MKISAFLRCAVGAAVLAAMGLGTVPAFAAGETGTLTGLETGYYDITATFTNTSVDGSCYMWADSAASTRGKTVLPKTTETSGTTVVVKGVYTNNGTIRYGLYNDGAGAASISDVTAARSRAETFYNGGYITSYNYAHDNGGRFCDFDGSEVDGIEYLGKMGMNAARIRVVNNPGKGRGGDGGYYLPEGYKDRADCLRLAKKAAAAGMDIVYSFNYSDYWADSEKQRVPSDWVERIKTDLGYDIESAEFLNAMTAEQKSQIVGELGDLLYDYTYDVLKELADNGLAPKYVSLGNEINAGILFPFANTYDAKLSLDDFKLKFDETDTGVPVTADWAALAELLNKGYDAVKAAVPEAQVIIHLADGSKMWNVGTANENSAFDWWYDAYLAQGGKFDVIGASYYPYWSGNTASTCKYFCDYVTNRYDRDIMIMETGYNWSSTRKDGCGGQLTAIDAYKDIYPDSQSGHKGYMAELINYMKLADRCIGVLYWDPMMVHAEKDGVSSIGWAINDSTGKPEANIVENTALFDFDGRAIETVQLYADTASASPRRVTEITAKYDTGGILTDVDVEKTTADKVSAAADDSTRVYVWDSLEGMRPLGQLSEPDSEIQVLPPAENKEEILDF